MQALAILFGALFTVAVATALGALLLRDNCDDLALRFICGAAVLSLLVFGLCSLGLVYPLVFLAVGAGAIGTAFRPLSRGFSSPRFQHKPQKLTYLLLGIFTLYFILYFFNSMAPESSPDGAAYHLGLVGRYLRDHGFQPNAGSIYAMMPGAVEMLFLFAFAFGRHSAAAMVHFTFLLALVWQIFSYGRRAGFPVAGACAALLIFASPLIGVDATSAYNDVALAAIAFSLFHLLQMLDENRSQRLLVAAGLVAGFAVASKYTGWLAVPYALAYVLWKRRRAREVGCVVFGAALMIAPWLAKNWIWIHNPVAPFFNQLFPNPYVMVSFEKIYGRMLAAYDLKSRWQIPLQVTTYGSLAGLLGPVFLLSPVAVLALRRRQGRQLLMAALVFGANYFSNIGARFLLPSLPFVALAMTLVLSELPHLAVAIVLLHAFISWPSMMPKYCRPEAWRLSKVPWREALRIKPEDGYLKAHLLYYGVDRMIESSTAPGSTIFTFKPIPEAYTSRRILVEYQSAENKISGAILWTASVPEYAPTWRLRFPFPRRLLRAVRVVQTNTGEDQWSIHEFRVFDGARELPREPRWRLTARPFPWGIQSAFDNSLATFWMCGAMLQPGQFVRVEFGVPQAADAVVIETAPNQWGIRLKLEGQLDVAGGPWQLLTPAPELSDAPRPLGLRRAVAEELQRRGIDYVLSFEGDMGSDDLLGNADIYGIRQVGEYEGARLYQLPRAGGGKP